ncbi:hypothetical protein SALBM311S_03159 [Streptomyces alboniger]
MENRPEVVVEPPDSRGLRGVGAGGEAVGSAWSLRELRRILRRLGYPKDMDVEDGSIRWCGGDSRTWPEHPVKRRVIMLLMMAGLLGSLVLLVVIGTPDALGGLTFAGRVTGYLFMLAGLVQGVSALAVLDFWGKRRLRFSGAAVLLGALIALAVDSLLMFLWLQETEYTPYLFAYFPLWCWSLWALWLLVREKTWRGIPHPKSFAAGITVTAVIAGANLAYSSMYQPASQPLLFSLEAKFGKPTVDPRSSFIDLPLTLRARNIGKVSAYIISDDYSIYGHLAKLSRDSGGLQGVKEAMESESGAELYARELETKTISAGRFYSPGNWLEPGEQYSAERMVRIPRTVDYDALEAYFSLTLLRRDRGRIAEAEFEYPHHSWDKKEGRFYCSPGDCGGEYLIYHGKVRHNNNMINVTRRPRYVTTWWSVTSEDSNVFSSISSFSFRPKEYIDERDNEREQERYGVTNVFAEAMMPFAALLEKVN